jgi:hypothetical protein
MMVQFGLLWEKTPSSFTAVVKISETAFECPMITGVHFRWKDRGEEFVTFALSRTWP